MFILRNLNYEKKNRIHLHNYYSKLTTKYELLSLP